MRRGLAATVLGALAVLAPAGVVRADPANPTDYESSVVGVTPPTETIRPAIVGGDSFFELTVDPGVEVVVLGYFDEPYLRFRPDGVVEENRRSPTTYQNTDRLGGEVPAGADATLPPDWRPVGGDGRYAWHDHRTHWMSADPPPAALPGDQIHSGAVPLVVNGAPVEVAVSTTWLRAPSRAPLIAGAAVGGALVILALAMRRRLVWPLLTVAAAAFGIGWWQYRSLPPETGPPLVGWLLPAVAVASALVAAALGRRLLAYALTALAALELAAWLYLRRESTYRALIPTDAPFWLDRGVMAAVGVVALFVAVAASVAMYRLPAQE